MRVMVLIKATEESEAGEMPSEELLSADERLQRGAGEGRRDAGGRGPAPELQGRAGGVLGRRAQGDRRPVRRDQGAAGRLLGVAGEVARRGDRVGQAHPEPGRRRTAWSRSARSSRPTTSATSSPPSCASRRRACARRPRRTGRRPGAPTISVPASDVNRTIDAVWRIESARLIAGLARIVRDVGVAEDLAQEALVAALEQWPESASRTTRAPGSWPRPSTARSTACAAPRCTSARRGAGREIELRGQSESPRPRGRDRRSVRRRPPAADLHRLPSGALDRGARRAHPAPARRPDHAGDRPRVPGLRRRPWRSGSCAPSARSRRRACRSRCPSAASSPSGSPRCSR